MYLNSQCSSSITFALLSLFCSEEDPDRDRVRIEDAHPAAAFVPARFKAQVARERRVFVTGIELESKLLIPRLGSAASILVRFRSRTPSSVHQKMDHEIYVPVEENKMAYAGDNQPSYMLPTV
eukprot:gene12111-biopygen275